MDNELFFYENFKFFINLRNSFDKNLFRIINLVNHIDNKKLLNSRYIEEYRYGIKLGLKLNNNELVEKLRDINDYFESEKMNPEDDWLFEARMLGMIDSREQAQMDREMIKTRCDDDWYM